MSKAGRSYNFGRKLDGTIATEQDWEKWREEFWEKELKRKEYQDYADDKYISEYP